jgi:tryptophan synthase beta chain
MTSRTPTKKSPASKAAATKAPAKRAAKTSPAMPPPNSYRTGPDERGFFGIYGGRFVAETLMPLILALEKAYDAAKRDPEFKKQLEHLNTHYAGRPSPLYFAERLTDHFRKSSKKGKGAKIYFKRDELNHTGSHKINNCLGQILLAKRMGKTRIIAETGAGQHGVAVATVCARFGLPCEIFMGATDVERQAPNVSRMYMLGAKVNPVTSGAGTLKDAMNEALRDWVANVDNTFYIIGTAAGPHPYPAMVRDFQSVIGRETREQMMQAEWRLPDALVAAIGGGSNAIGLFHPFLDDPSVKIYGVEAGGHGIDVENGHAASMTGGRPGVLHGNRTYLLQDDDGQILEGHSISAGLDYPGVGPEHSWLRDTGRVTYVPATDKEALEAFKLCTLHEGIIPALEPAHALAYVTKLAPTLPADDLLVMNLCGRGDKDVAQVAKMLGMKG